MIIEIYKELKTPFAITEQQSDFIFNLLKSHLRIGEIIHIHFNDIEEVSMEFIDGFYGRLYGEYSREIIHRHIIFCRVDKKLNLMNSLVESENKATILYNDNQKINIVYGLKSIFLKKMYHCSDDKDEICCLVYNKPSNIEYDQIINIYINNIFIGEYTTGFSKLEINRNGKIFYDGGSFPFEAKGVGEALGLKNNDELLNLLFKNKKIKNDTIYRTIMSFSKYNGKFVH